MKQKNKGKSRKQIRKESRLAKKAKKNEYFSKKKERSQFNNKKSDSKRPMLEESSNRSVLRPKLKKVKKNKSSGKGTTVSLQDEFRRELLESEKKRKEINKKMQKERIKKLQEDNEAEEREIRRLEKQLRLKKRSEKSINNFFAEDGLDYLLEVCERKKLNDVVAAENNFKDDDSDFGDDYAQVTGKRPKKNSEELKKNSISDVDSDECPEELPSRRGSKLNKPKELPKKISEGDSKSEDVEEQSIDEDDVESEIDDDESEGMNSSELDSESDLDVDDDSERKSSSKENKRKLKPEKGGKNLKKVKLDGQKREGEAIGNPFSDDEVSSLEDNDDLEVGSHSKHKMTSHKEAIVSKPSKLKSLKGLKSGNKREESESKNQKNKGKIESQKAAKRRERKVQRKDILEDEIGNPFSDDEVSTLGGDSEGASEDESKQKGKEFWEDIYGRTRDKEGNVVTAYQPPHLRKKKEEDATDSEKMTRLKKQLKGLLNRLAENNMISISSQVESLYMSHSRNEMNETLWALLRESLIAETMTPERLVAEHAMLISILGANIGGEVSAYCLQRCVTEWHRMWQERPAVEDKKTNNVLLLLSYLYHFKLFHCILLYDILELLLAKVDEKEVELVLLVLRTVGFSLRKDDPARLKDFVLKVQVLANGQEAAAEGSRARFMLETVLAIKNNNMSKIPNYNPEYGERIKKTLRACVRKGNYNAELKITLEDLLKADERGRWWVVGSAWTGELPGEKDSKAPHREDKPKKVEEGFSNKLMELAKKQRMNTDTRRTIFCIIMSAEDYLDAFEKLLKLALKGPPEREIMNVLLHCLLHEKQYNPYYTHLARRFCLCDRRFQVMLQFAVWDKIQDLKSLSSTCVTNLAKFLGFLILEKSLAISVLKVVHFAELDKPAVRFIRQVLLGILLADSEEAIVSAFTRIANSKPLKLFREGLRLFLHHFVLRNSKAVAGIDIALLTIRVKLADSALSASDRGLSF